MTTTASILGLERPLLTTAMGILPHRDPHAALDLAFSLDIPFWPQLPNLSFSEDTYVQTVRGIPGVEVDHEGLRILFDEDGFYAGLEEYLSLDPLDDLFAVTVEESATFGGFLWLLNIGSAGRLGFGDVKAGALVGLAAGAFSFHVVWWVGMLAFTGALVASHVPRRRGSIPLGPFLFASYVVAATVLGGS